MTRTSLEDLQNLVEPTTNMGVELLGLFRRSPLAITASYTYVYSRETEGGVTRDVELTPRHSIGLVGMWENEDGRVGVEWYTPAASGSKTTLIETRASHTTSLAC